MFLKKYGNSQMDINSLITIYIVLYVIKCMREQLGIEATLEYARKYMEKLEEQHPKIRSYAERSMSDVDIDKMYKEAML